MKTIADQKPEAKNLGFKYSFKMLIISLTVLLFSALLANLAFPEFNISILAFFTITPVFALTRNERYFKSAFLGYFWSYWYCVMLIFWLREIHIASPFILALLLACFYLPVFLINPFLRRRILYPAKVLIAGHEAVCQHQVAWYRKTFYCLTLAAIWTICEWLRSWVLTGLPWNYLATTQWQNISFIQIAEYTGIWGISFIIAFFNFTFVEDFTKIKNLLQFKIKQKFLLQFLPISLFVALFLIVLNFTTGFFITKKYQKAYEKSSDKTIVKFGVVQGDLSQRRHAGINESFEALDKYVKLTKKLRLRYPDISVVVWPESAVPMPYNIGGHLGISYRAELFNLISKTKIPFLIGSMYFDEIKGKNNYKMVNSLLHFGANTQILNRYDKIHIVPFGEFVPAREYMPKFLLKIIDMGRDLKAGTDYSPLKLQDNVFIGVSICFEDVFAEIACKEAQLGANVLLTVSNDAWYPKSSEPTQHLANSVFRCVETRLPMVRNGNNSSSVAISPTGEIIDSVFLDENGNMNVEKRSEAVKQFNVNVEKKPRHSFYTRYGNIFIWFCWAIVIIALMIAVENMYCVAKHCDNLMKKLKNC
ncbi:apolipoprotein N-acyltransferase [Lentisphaerota bacterium WC36G]|nr:apolipoprotein N-acyltransferase [Lentisphaerae bacterium WC36]